MEPKCGVCLVAVPRSDLRRNIASASSRRVTAALKDFLERQWPQMTVTSVPEHGYSFVCLQCFRSLEKLLKLRESIEDIEKKLLENLRRLAPSAANVDEAADVSSTPHRSKRQRNEGDFTPRGKRRRLLSTPVRTAIKLLQPSQASPLVAVRIAIVKE